MFEKIVETLSNTGKTVGEKTKQGTDIVKANVKISTEEKALNDLYCEIGKRYYENNSENPCCDEMKELFDKVSEKVNEIANLKNQVRQLKGVVMCEKCGAEVGLENDFCGKCGAKLVKPEPVIEEIPADEVIDHEDTVEVTDEEGKPEINIEVAEDESADTETEE